jgi:hypothetical protein
MDYSFSDFFQGDGNALPDANAHGAQGQPGFPTV